MMASRNNFQSQKRNAWRATCPPRPFTYLRPNFNPIAWAARCSCRLPTPPSRAPCDNLVAAVRPHSVGPPLAVWVVRVPARAETLWPCSRRIDSSGLLTFPTPTSVYCSAAAPLVGGLARREAGLRTRRTWCGATPVDRVAVVGGWLNVEAPSAGGRHISCELGTVRHQAHVAAAPLRTMRPDPSPITEVGVGLSELRHLVVFRGSRVLEMPSARHRRSGLVAPHREVPSPCTDCCSRR